MGIIMWAAVALNGVCHHHIQQYDLQCFHGNGLYHNKPSLSGLTLDM